MPKLNERAEEVVGLLRELTGKAASAQIRLLVADLPQSEREAVWREFSALIKAGTGPWVTPEDAEDVRQTVLPEARRILSRPR